MEEAPTLQKKKNTISKGKLKKSLRNVLCRPDQVFWPEITEDEGKRLESALKKYKIDIPEYKKPHWKDLKLIPKEKRPKQPTLKKVEGLMLGIRECSDSIHRGQCSAIIIEAKVNPRLIVEPVIEMCTGKNIPILCLTGLRKVTEANFGVPTSCLGIKCGCLLDLKNQIEVIAKKYQRPYPPKQLLKVEKMDIEENVVVDAKSTDLSSLAFLYRTNKKTRVFVPTSPDGVSKPVSKFIGQDFIEFTDNPTEKNSKTYMKMILKRISNNPDRVRKK